MKWSFVTSGNAADVVSFANGHIDGNVASQKMDAQTASLLKSLIALKVSQFPDEPIILESWEHKGGSSLPVLHDLHLTVKTLPNFQSSASKGK